MKNSKKNPKIKAQNSSWSFTSKKLSLYGGLAPVMKFIEHIHLPWELETLFPSRRCNARKFKLTQLFLAVILASMSGVYRLTGIAVFTCDPLVMRLLGLVKGLNKDVISTEFKKLGQRGARTLEDLCGRRIKQMLTSSACREFTLDADSTVKTVYGKQQGAAKGYNPEKKGGNAYHPLMVFVTEKKWLIHSWFRTGSAYTSNGIVEFLKQTGEYIPSGAKIFFRADSGFFSGALFDYLESLDWNYLVKVKYKGLTEFLKKQSWTPVENHKNQWVCEFSYRGKSWKKSRPLKAVRRITHYETREEFGKIVPVPVYEYAAYCTTLNLDAWSAHEKYVERAVCETWIEQIKSQLYAASTLTDDFWANDILWQLAVLAYNLSLKMRLAHPEIYKEEHRTFREWFIRIAAEVGGRDWAPEIRLYQFHVFRKRWEAFAACLIC
jgi:hypothetical protein